jgi:photosystem II stability/assembly factor-like uncharacterized protein
LNCRALLILIVLIIVSAPGMRAQETVFMSILGSRAHRIGAADNPLVGIFVSTDRGATWTHRGWREYIRTFYTEEGPDGTIWAACGNGILRSIDGGLSWKITSGWEITEVLKVAVDPANPATVFAATAYGIFRTTDHGGTWQEKTHGFHRKFSSDVEIDAMHPQHVFASSEEGVYESTDGGESWKQSGLQNIAVRTIVQDPVRKNSFWAGTETQGVFLSMDGGKAWERRSDGLNTPTIYALAVNPQNDSQILAGSHDAGIYRSDDRGLHWQQSSTGLGKQPVHAMIILPSDPNVVLAGTINGGLYRSTDGGRTWKFDGQEQAQVWGLSTMSH